MPDNARKFTQSAQARLCAGHGGVRDSRISDRVARPSKSAKRVFKPKSRPSGAGYAWHLSSEVAAWSQPAAIRAPAHGRSNLPRLEVSCSGAGLCDGRLFDLAKHCILVSGEHSRIVNRAVMVDLPPLSILIAPEHAGGANGKLQRPSG